MLNLIKTDINILIHKKGFQISFLCILVYALFVTIYYAMVQRGMDASELYSPVKLSGLNADTKFVWFFCRWFPFIVILPAGFSIVNDKKTKIRVLIKSRVGNAKYYVSKQIAAFIVTFVTVTVPFLLQCVVNHIIFPGVANRDLTNWETYSETYFCHADAYLFSELFYENEYLYFLVTLMITGVFSGCLAILLVGISTFDLKYKAFLFLPIYILFYFMEMLSGYITGYSTYINDYMTLFDINGSKNIVYYVVVMLISLVIGVALTMFNAKRKERVD